MKVQVITDAVETRSFPAREGKAAVSFREQKAAVIREGDFPLPFKLTLDDDQRPYIPGIYQISPESLESGKFGGLEFGRRIRLVPDLGDSKPGAGK